MEFHRQAVFSFLRSTLRRAQLSHMADKRRRRMREVRRDPLRQCQSLVVLGEKRVLRPISIGGRQPLPCRTGPACCRLGHKNTAANLCMRLSDRQACHRLGHKNTGATPLPALNKGATPLPARSTRSNRNVLNCHLVLEVSAKCSTLLNVSDLVPCMAIPHLPLPAPTVHVRCTTCTVARLLLGRPCRPHPRGQRPLILL